MVEISIGTHDGKFHADEVFACAALWMIHPKAEIIRTRDRARLDACTFCVDVGGAYDIRRNRYDHHQKDFLVCRPNGVKYSSFGLVWRHFGEEIAGSSECARMVDERLVQGIDASDTAQSLFESRTQARFKGVHGDPIGSTSLSAGIAGMNALRMVNGADSDRVFLQAVQVADVFLRSSAEEARQIITAQEIVFRCIRRALSEPHNRVLVLDQGLPWKTALFVYEQQQDVTPLLFTVYPCEEEPGHSYIQTIPVGAPNDRRSRKTLPQAWLDSDIQTSLGITFCHRDLFLAKASSRRAVELARQAVMA